MSLNALTKGDEGLPPDIVKLMADVERHAAELQEIQFAAAEVSNRVQNLAQSFDEAADAVLGKFAKFSELAYKRSGTEDALLVAGVGLVIGGLGKAIAKGVEKVGGRYARAKEEKAMARVLELKQEVAEKKLASVQKMVEPLRRAQTRLEKLLQRDASKVLSREKLSRTASTQRQLGKVFSSAVKAEVSLVWVEYFSDEFGAWLDGKHESATPLPDAKHMLEGQVDRLLDWSDPGPYASIYDIPTVLPQGMILAIDEPKICYEAIKRPQVDRLVRDLATANARAAFIPIGAPRRFREDYEAILGDEPFIAAAAKKKKNRYVATVAGVMLLLGTGTVSVAIGLVQEQERSAATQPAGAGANTVKPAPPARSQPKPQPKVPAGSPVAKPSAPQPLLPTGPEQVAAVDADARPRLPGSGPSMMDHVFTAGWVGEGVLGYCMTISASEETKCESLRASSGRRGQLKSPPRFAAGTPKWPFGDDLVITWRQKGADRLLVGAKVVGTPKGATPLKLRGEGSPDEIHLDWVGLSPDGEWLGAVGHTFAGEYSDEFLLGVVPARLPAARAYNIEGLRAHRAKDYVRSAALFRAAKKTDPEHKHAAYNLACALALRGDSGARAALADAISRGGVEVRKKARKDPDFERVAGSGWFKEMTGPTRE